MASGDGANKVHEDIARVQKCIEKCLMVYMNKKEAMDTLITQDHQDPDVAEIVWHRLETQNPEFFKAYHLMRLVRQQIVEFNRLLSEQAELMRRTGLSGMTSIPMSNESNVSPTNQSSTWCVDQIMRQMENADSQQLNPTCSSNAFSRGLSIQSCMQGTLDVPTHDRMIDVPPNTVLPQNSNVPQALNGMIVEREPLYAGSLPFNFGPHNSFFETCPMMVDANVSSFTNVESNTQPLNGMVLNDDAYSFGFLEQIPQNFGLSELAADYSGDMDALHSLY